MLHIPKIADYLKALTDEGKKDFVVLINILNIREKNYIQNQVKKKYLGKVVESAYSFLSMHDEGEAKL